MDQLYVAIAFWGAIGALSVVSALIAADHFFGEYREGQEDDEE